MRDRVLIIHGTWNRPDGGNVAWYELDERAPDNFAARLNRPSNETAPGVNPSIDPVNLAVGDGEETRE